MAVLSKPATTPNCWRATAGMPASGAINNWRPALRPIESTESPSSPARQAVRLLSAAARPDRHHLAWAIAWLVIAAGLEVLGPIMGKALIDEHLLPHKADWPR